MIFTVAFWKGAGERALKTFLQAAISAFLGTLGLSVTGSTGFNVLAHLPVLADAAEIGAGFGLGAAILSLCTSLGNARFTAGVQDAVIQPVAVATVEPVDLANDAADEKDPGT